VTRSGKFCTGPEYYSTITLAKSRDDAGSGENRLLRWGNFPHYANALTVRAASAQKNGANSRKIVSFDGDFFGFALAFYLLG
jgi:hypothetical protein